MVLRLAAPMRIWNRGGSMQISLLGCSEVCLGVVPGIIIKAYEELVVLWRRLKLFQVATVSPKDGELLGGSLNEVGDVRTNLVEVPELTGLGADVAGRWHPHSLGQKASLYNNRHLDLCEGCPVPRQSLYHVDWVIPLVRVVKKGQHLVGCTSEGLGWSGDSFRARAEYDLVGVGSRSLLWAPERVRDRRRASVPESRPDVAMKG
ncbi:hypothetical protein Tco_0990300 [Tanacetum coccineum]|uniref:Uncharacterized protein n=1 Tax=Tanacetum coccineum TaxID=301880 RepID=A0ABQ5EW19_9ASTR